VTLNRRRLLFWSGLVVVFVLAFVPRLVYPVSRYMLWYDRAITFWEALERGDLEETYRQYHPGVTTMWIAGLGLRAYTSAHGLSFADLHEPPPLSTSPQSPPGRAAVAAIAAVVSVCIALSYALLSRLTKWPVAFCAGVFLALDSYYLTHSKMVHVDALMASFMLVSALALICYMQETRTLFLVGSGAFAGLAFLTKSPSFFLIPYTGFVLALQTFQETADEDSGWIHKLGRFTWRCLAWGLVAGALFFLLWPAMWQRPVEMLRRVVLNATMHAELPHPNPNFFLGQVTDEPGILYYPVALALKSTPITLPCFLAAIVFLLWRWRRGQSSRVMWLLLLYGIGFLLMMTYGAKKWARYILPVFTTLDVLAAWGLVQLAEFTGRRQAWRKWTWLPGAIIAVALFIHAAAVLRHHPYYGTQHNLLLGGSRTAERFFHMGDQGEGLDLAARFLNTLAGAESLAVGVRNRETPMFRANFVGDTRSIDDPEVLYRVFTINDIQRETSSERWWALWESCQAEGPIWQTAFDGVTYVWICEAYARSRELLDIAQRREVVLGDHIELLGYDVSADTLSSGDELTVTLYWRSDGQVTEDDHVFVHLQDADGTMAAQHDGVPAGSDRPTWSWQEGEIITDAHTLTTDGALPNGTYTLSVGMYSYPDGLRLAATGSDGARLPEDRVPLQDIRVVAP
jgi:hypothetical protein